MNKYIGSKQNIRSHLFPLCGQKKENFQNIFFWRWFFFLRTIPLRIIYLFQWQYFPWSCFYVIFSTCIIKCADSMGLINSCLTAVVCLPGVLTCKLLEKWLLCVQCVRAMLVCTRWHTSVNMHGQVTIILCLEWLYNCTWGLLVCVKRSVGVCAYSGRVGVNICSPEECVSGQQWEFLSSALVGHRAAACLSKLSHWLSSLLFFHLLHFPFFSL